jgi:site-specific DNA recombinase
VRAVTYLRVSTREQSEEGYSLAAQRNVIGRYLDEHGWELVREFCDAGESARSADRPQYQALLDYLAEHDDIDVLVAHKLDRLARNLEDHAALRARLRQHHVRLVSVTENLEDSPSGKLIEGILASLNEFYGANLSQEIRKGQLQKLNEGGWPAHAPVGYRNLRADGGHAVMVPDDDQASLVRQTFELYATGTWALTALQVEMEQRGLRTRAGRPLVRSRIAAMLRNPIYIGRLQWNGDSYDGDHTPLVSADVFSRVQTVLDTKRLAGERRRRHTHPLKGLLICAECGGRLTISVAKGQFRYFFCLGTQQPAGRCHQPYVPVDVIETAVANLYRSLHLPKRVLDQVAGAIEDAVTRRRADVAAVEVTMRRRLEQLERDHDRAMRAYYADALDTERLRAEQERIASEQAHTRALLVENRERYTHLDRLAETALAHARHLHTTYTHASPTVQRALNQAIFTQLTVADRTLADVTYHPPFNARPSVVNQ